MTTGTGHIRAILSRAPTERLRAPVRAFAFASLMFLLASCASVSRIGVDRVRNIDLAPPHLPQSLDGYRLVFVSDIHYQNNFSARRLDTLVDAINEEKPDCVILGGDYTLSAAEMKDFAKRAGRLKAPEGVYAVSGNHDFYNSQKEICRVLRAEGIVVLDEDDIVTPRGLTIAGINEFRDIYPDIARFKKLTEASACTILVSHDPDFAEETDISPYATMLSGHTHGGQITVFGYAPIIPSAYGQKYRTGTVMKDGTPVVVSNGAGYSGVVLRLRVCAPSDFLLLTLRANGPTKGR